MLVKLRLRSFKSRSTGWRVVSLSTETSRED